VIHVSAFAALIAYGFSKHLRARNFNQSAFGLMAMLAGEIGLVVSAVLIPFD
jgi:ABC-type Co2+ transport system permease subunit